ncbi:MAG: riboflavin biosynthesis protein RibF [Phycisphaerales bacterium]|nr:riboflavin biosynthesis protein RibF [Phycisphaerales bacterium]MCB9836543.1 riboflavin biosynthesis protein RibF [Phycisphaera sp.]
MASGPSVVTIGNFDGCHAGHARLIHRAHVAADKAHGRVVVMSFFPHPSTVLRPGTEPSLLTTWERRVELLQGLGADEVICLKPTRELLSLEPDAFVEQHLLPLSPVRVIEGKDFRFGSKRRGDLGVLRVLGEAHGFVVEEVEQVRTTLNDETEIPASSTVIRELLNTGRVRDAERVLGRHHRVEGLVQQGDRLGREIGCPTANVVCETLPPADGVYAGTATLPTGQTLPAAISMGTRPTVTGSAERRFEVHILGAERDGAKITGLPEYGWRLVVDIHAWLREQIRYASLEELIEQLKRDCDRTLEIIGRSPETTTAR